jgi:hypothetical protein
METPPAAAAAPAATPSGADTPPKPPAPAPAPPTPPPTAPPATAAAASATNDYDKGITAERARIAALQKYDKPATHEIIVKAIADGKTVADITDELFAALEKPAQQSARRTDSSTLNRISGSDTTPSGDEADAQSRECGERLTKAVQAQLGRRGMKRPAALHGQN